MSVDSLYAKSDTEPLELQGTIMIAEDDHGIRNLFQMGLERRGYRVFAARDGVEAIEMFRRYGADLLVLDVMMPRLDGFSTCRAIRAFSNVPIIVCTVLNQPDDIENGLSISGADDYIVKPFSFDVLDARIQALLRRVSWGQDPPSLSLLALDGIELNAETREVKMVDKTILLSPTENRLLHYLMSHPHQIIAQETLMAHVWGYQPVGKKLILHTNISRLRQKIEDDPAHPRLIETVAHFGYRFNGTV